MPSSNWSLFERRDNMLYLFLFVSVVLCRDEGMEGPVVGVLGQAPGWGGWPRGGDVTAGCRRSRQEQVWSTSAYYTPYTPFTRSKIIWIAPVYGHSLFNITKRIMFVFIVLSLFDCPDHNPPKIWIKIIQVAIQSLHGTIYRSRSRSRL